MSSSGRVDRTSKRTEIAVLEAEGTRQGASKRADIGIRKKGMNEIGRSRKAPLRSHYRPEIRHLTSKQKGRGRGGTRGGSAEATPDVWATRRGL